MTGIERAAESLQSARAIFIGAGAGMGVDSGLPDFRGNEGFWRAYPPLAKLGLSFVNLANPRWFVDDPALAWGFYGHRLNLYRETVPHAGFDVLRRLGAARDGGAFVFTSNVDGQFQRAGFGNDQILECHGSLHHLQCVNGCTDQIWDAVDVVVEVDPEFRAREPLPSCPRCAGIARPNVLMFGDLSWQEDRAAEQQRALRRWISTVDQLAVVECGAGTAVPTVRWQCESVAAEFGVPLIRINPRESHGPPGTIGIAAPALEALCAIDEMIG